MSGAVYAVVGLSLTNSRYVVGATLAEVAALRVSAALSFALRMVVECAGAGVVVARRQTVVRQAKGI